MSLRTLETLINYRHVADDFDIVVTCDLDKVAKTLSDQSPGDAEEIERLVRAAREFDALVPPVEARELTSLRERLRAIWEARSAMGSVFHFKKPVDTWAQEHLKSERLRRLLTHLIPGPAPTLFLAMVLGYLEKGYLSRPVGGTAAFRDALASAYRRAGGEVMLHATVDEVLVENGQARGVRLAGGTMLEADFVLSTSSAPETVLRLHGGRFDATPTQKRLETWQLFEPIVLASFVVARPYSELDSLQIIDGIPGLEIGGRINDSLYVRLCNDDPSFAPKGHSVVQAMLKTDYGWRATRGSRYGAAKDEVAETVLRVLEPIFRSCAPRFASWIWPTVPRRMGFASHIGYFGGRLDLAPNHTLEKLLHIAYSEDGSRRLIGMASDGGRGSFSPARTPYKRLTFGPSSVIVRPVHARTRRRT